MAPCHFPLAADSEPPYPSPASQMSQLHQTHHHLPFYPATFEAFPSLSYLSASLTRVHCACTVFHPSVSSRHISPCTSQNQTHTSLAGLGRAQEVWYDSRRQSFPPTRIIPIYGTSNITVRIKHCHSLPTSEIRFLVTVTVSCQCSTSEGHETRATACAQLFYHTTKHSMILTSIPCCLIKSCAATLLFTLEAQIMAYRSSPILHWLRSRTDRGSKEIFYYPKSLSTDWWFLWRHTKTIGTLRKITWRNNVVTQFHEMSLQWWRQERNET